MKIKFLALCLLSLLLFTSCEKKKVRSAVEKTMSEIVRDKKSLKIDKIIIKKDTVPLFFNKEISGPLNDFMEATKVLNRYEGMSSLWNNEREQARFKQQASVFVVKHAIKSAKPEVQFIACAEISANNAFGATVSNRYIFVVDKDTKEVLAYSDVDDDFMLKAFALYYAQTGNDIEQDKYGNYKIDKMSFGMQCVFAKSLDDIKE